MEEPQSPELAPPGDENENKDAHINLRISSADKKQIEGKAARAGLSAAEYMRRAGLGKRIVERVPPELRRQIGAAGNNLNQLTRLANAGKLNGAGVEALNELINRLLQTLK